MTEQELLAAALAEMKKATFPPVKWCGYIQDGYQGHEYDWMKTDNFRAQQLLWQAAHATPTPPQPSGLTLQRTIFWANITDDAVQHACRLKGWRHALTADPAYTPTLAQVNALKSASAGVDAWGNQLEIGASAITLFRGAWGLERIIQQAETKDEAALMSAVYCIGNFTKDALGVQWDRLKALADRGVLACSHEAYDGNPGDDDTQGLPVSSFTLGVAMDAGVHYPVVDLLAKTPAGARSSVCIWHGAGLTPADWVALEAL